MSVNVMANQTYKQHMDAISTENLLNFSVLIEDEDDVWHKLFNLYWSMAQNPTTDNDKRRVLFQLAEDARQQYAKLKHKKSFQINSAISKFGANRTKIHSSRDFLSFLIAHGWLIFFIVILIILVSSLLVAICLVTIRRQSFEDTRYVHRNSSTGLQNDSVQGEVAHTTSVFWLTAVTTGSWLDMNITTTRNKRSSPISITTTNTTEVNTMPCVNSDVGKDRANNVTSYKSLFDHRNRPVKFWLILIGLLALMLFLLVSFCFRFENIIVFRHCMLYSLHRFMRISAKDINSSRINRSEKVVFLDPMLQYSHLHILSDDNLFVYTSIYDCFREFNSNHRIDYTLFLSFSMFEMYSYELSQLSNVSLGIFHEDNDQLHLQISKSKYHVRFIFTEARLLEHLRHAIMLNYASQGYRYRREGLERESDECFHAASEQCRMLTNELEQQSSTLFGREAEELIH